MKKMIGKLAYVVLESVFFLSIYAISLNMRDVSVPLLLVMGIAVFRTARSVSFNKVFEWLREPFCTVEPDSCGAGANVHSKGSIFGDLLECPICTGTWASVVLYGLYCWQPRLGTVLVYVLALAGISETLHWLNDLLEWSGRLTRVLSGKISPDPDAKG